MTYGSGKRILVIGGRGFLGNAVCERIAHSDEGHKVFTFDRKPGGEQHIQGSITSIDDLERAMKHIDTVVNLVGLSPLKEPQGTSYHEVHVQSVKNILKACAALRVRNLVHVSALGADHEKHTEYLRTKGHGESLVLHSDLNVCVICPSLIYDVDNEFVRMACKLSWTRLFPNIPARAQPVYRGDVAQLIALAAQGKVRQTRLEVAGPDTMTLFEMARKIYARLGRSCVGIPLSFIRFNMRLLATFGAFGLGADQITSLTLDNTSESAANKKHVESYVTLRRFDDWLASTDLRHA